MDDRIWGTVLITIGVVMILLHPWSDRLNGWLQGLPNDAMTGALILLAITITCVAIVGRAATKALLITWIVMP